MLLLAEYNVFWTIRVENKSFCKPKALRLALRDKIPDTNALIYPQYQ